MRRGFTLIELMIAIAFVLILATIIIVPLVGLFGGAFSNYSDGDRTGVVYKISHKGFIFKSWEGEMNLGGMATDGNGQVVPNSFKFSVKDDAVVKQIQAASTAGKRVTLHYHQYGIKPITIDSDYVVDEVKTNLPLEK